MRCAKAQICSEAGIRRCNFAKSLLILIYKTMKIFIGIIAIMAVIVGCNSTRKSAEQSSEIVYEQTVEQSRNKEMRIDSLLQQALIVLDSVDMEIPVLNPCGGNVREKTRIKSRQMIIDVSNDMKSITMKMDSNEIKKSYQYSAESNIQKNSSYESRAPDWILTIAIVLMIAFYLWSMHKNE